MGRNAAFGALGAILVAGASASASDGPPPLTAPAVSEGGSAAASTSAEERKAAPSSVLALPGLTLPRQREAPRSKPAEALPAPNSAPPLAGPSGMTEAPVLPPRRARTADPARSPGRVTQPLTLESVPSTELEAPLPPPSPSLSQRQSGRRGAEVSASRPPPGFFGRMFAPAAADSRRETGSAPNIRVVPRSDPAADAALKRRLEKQIRDGFGDRVRAVDVRVVGRDVTIRARATRIWQRRAIRRALESLPGLGNHRTTVEVD